MMAAGLVCTMREFDDAVKEVGRTGHKLGQTDPAEWAKRGAELDAL
jgi:hypothetical protein